MAEKITWTTEQRKLGELVEWERNPRRLSKHDAEHLAKSLDGFGVADPLIVNTDNHIIGGHMRRRVMLQSGYRPGDLVDVRVPSRALTEREAEELAIRLNKNSGEWDFDLLANGFEVDDLLEWGFTEEELTGAEFGDKSAQPEGIEHKSLMERFIVPPFSVLDARQGYWQERKRAWLALGIESELGRGDVMPSGASSVYAGRSEWAGGQRGGMRSSPPHGPTVTQNADGTLCDSRASRKGWQEKQNNGLLGISQQARSHYASPGGSPRAAANLGKDGHTERGDGRGRAVDYGTEGNASEQSGTSIFDPVLCELVYRWFCTRGGSVLDPFAGGSVRGVVASLLNLDYTGIDLRSEQIEANEAQGREICKGHSPRWITGDSRNINSLLEEGEEYDLIFSCPPYFDLELYSEDDKDLSNAGNYAFFIEAYNDIVAQAVARLKNNRFACFVVGDIRDKRGFYRNFVSDTITAFQDAGATLYNEAILVTAVGSLPIRIGKQFGSYRKLGKTHQNVLVFYKGDPKAIKAEFPEIEVPVIQDESGE